MRGCHENVHQKSRTFPTVKKTVSVRLRPPSQSKKIFCGFKHGFTVSARYKQVSKSPALPHVRSSKKSTPSQAHPIAIETRNLVEGVTHFKHILLLTSFHNSW